MLDSIDNVVISFHNHEPNAMTDQRGGSFYIGFGADAEDALAWCRRPTMAAAV